MTRLYESTHPWLTFSYTVLPDLLNLQLGEAFSKCQHLANSALQPALASRLASIYLAKGVNATTAIEGNTLSEEEVGEILAGAVKVPNSQRYLQQEVENVTKVLTQIQEESHNTERFRLTPEWLKAVNYQILEGIDVDEHIVPGEYTTKTLVVGNSYRAAPPEDVPFLMDKFCKWINTMLDDADDMEHDLYRFIQYFLAAVLGHLYFVWIHPFGDGNGRTARALESALLAHSKIIPWISTTLLSDHYNRTRTEYVRRLDRASKKGEVQEFIVFAAEGFVDHLREQVFKVQSQQRLVAWVNYVHEQFRDQPQTDATRRRRELVLALPADIFTPINGIPDLNTSLARQYAGKTSRTVARDVNELFKMKLVERHRKRGIRPRVEVMDSFMPQNSVPLPISAISPNRFLDSIE